MVRATFLHFGSMVRWYHAIFTAYGFWLPNDPRGSWSTFVGSWELFKFGGGATKTDLRRSVASAAHDREFRLKAKHILKYPPVKFNEAQRELITAGIAQACEESSYSIHACAIGYDHFHVILARHEKTVEEVVHHLKSRATKHMNREGVHPLRKFIDRKGVCPTPWAEKCWHVFINDDRQLQAAIEYVQRHPMKEGLPPQYRPLIVPV